MVALSHLAPCTVRSCGNSSVITRGCFLCQRQGTTCESHLVEAFHECSSLIDEEKWRIQSSMEIQLLMTRLNVSALLNRASELNHGKKCNLIPRESSGNGAMMGCCNYHIWIIFSSGEKWLARASEYATLKFLERTKVPAPRAYGYDLASNPHNEVGVTYLLFEAMGGAPFIAYRATAAQKLRVYQGVSDILIELSKHPVSKACSFNLNVGSDTPEAAQISSVRGFSLGLYGPFDSSVDYFRSIAEQYLDLVCTGNLQSQFPVETFLVYSALRDGVSKQIVEQEMEGQGMFYLKHIDDKGDHLLLNADGDVIGIIDWQAARCVPASEAFGPSLLTSDLHALFTGKSGLTEDDKLLARLLREKGAGYLADIMERNEMARRFNFGLASGSTGKEVWNLIKGLLEAFNLEVGRSFNDWKSKYLERYRNDVRLQELLRKY